MSSDDTSLATGRRRLKAGFNPGGRPKGSKNRKTMMREIAFTTLRVPQDGKKSTVTVMDAILLQLRKAALEEASPRAMKKLKQLMEKCCPEMIGENAGVLIAPAPISPEDWIKRELEANKTRKPPPGVYDDEDDEDD